MKRLWKQISPCLADVQGFQAVIDATDGLGIVDDPSTYKPIGDGRARSGEERQRRGRQGHGGRGRGSTRVVNTEIRNADIITGTEEKVLTAFRENAERLGADFVLLCHAPSSSMIGSDLEANAGKISELSGIPAAYVNIDGGKDYLYGISMTLETMGKLLLAKTEKRPNTVNLLGCNSIDWTENMAASCDTWLVENGFQVLAHWGMRESVDRLKRSAGAAANLVVNAAGMRLARYMEAKLGIPYIAGAPFGKSNCETLLASLRGACPEPPAVSSDDPAVLIVGEQFQSNAIRGLLREREDRNIRVVSLADMDKSVMEPGDKKLSGEDDLAEQLANESVKLVLCDPDCKALITRQVRWVPMPNAASFAPAERVAVIDMVGSKLDDWLENQLNGGA